MPKVYNNASAESVLSRLVPPVRWRCLTRLLPRVRALPGAPR